MIMTQEKKLKILSTAYTENVERGEDHLQVLIWSGAVMWEGEEIPLIETSFFDTIGIDVKFPEAILTN